MIVSFSWRLVLEACGLAIHPGDSLQLAACSLSLLEIFHSCARTPGSGPGGRV